MKGRSESTCARKSGPGKEVRLHLTASGGAGGNCRVAFLRRKHRRPSPPVRTIWPVVSLEGCQRSPSTHPSVINEDSVLEEAIANLRGAAQRIRATQNVMHSQGMTENVNYRELVTRLSTALPMAEAAYVEAKRRCSVL